MVIISYNNMWALRPMWTNESLMMSPFEVKVLQGKLISLSSSERQTAKASNFYKSSDRDTSFEFCDDPDTTTTTGFCSVQTETRDTGTRSELVGRNAPDSFQPVGSCEGLVGLYWIVVASCGSDDPRPISRLCELLRVIKLISKHRLQQFALKKNGQNATSFRQLSSAENPVSTCFTFARVNVVHISFPVDETKSESCELLRVLTPLVYALQTVFNIKLSRCGGGEGSFSYKVQGSIVTTSSTPGFIYPPSPFTLGLKDQCQNSPVVLPPVSSHPTNGFKGNIKTAKRKLMPETECSTSTVVTNQLSTKRLSHIILGELIMSQGEEKDCYNEPSNERRKSFSSGDEQEQPLNISDTSQESHGHEDRNGHSGIREEDTEDTPNFLFMGPVGKKRRMARERLRSGDSISSSEKPHPESPARGLESPTSPTTEAHRLEYVRPRDHSLRARGRSASATFTRFSLPEDQPLNLSLPTGSSTVSKSSSDSGTSKLSEQFLQFYDDPEHHNSSSRCLLPSPSVSLSGRSERESGGETILSEGEFSPTFSLSLSPSSSSIKDFPHGVPTPMCSMGATSSANISLPGSSAGNGMSGAGGKRKLQCPDCGKEFSQLRNFRYHRSRHEGTSQFACTCPICGKSFNDKGYLSSHLKIHRNAKEYQCEWCEKSFNQRVAYNMHVRIHTGHKPHKCHLCPKAFSRKMLLRQHLRTHTGERPYKCEICSKAFADRSNMLLHQKLHTGVRPHRCDQCGKNFSKRHHLLTHLNHHAGIKPYQCDKCKACFSQSSNMKTHYRKCTGVASTTPTSAMLTQMSQPHLQLNPSSSFRQPPLHHPSVSASATVSAYSAHYAGSQLSPSQYHHHTGPYSMPLHLLSSETGHSPSSRSTYTNVFPGQMVGETTSRSVDVPVASVTAAALNLGLGLSLGSPQLRSPERLVAPRSMRSSSSVSSTATSILSPLSGATGGPFPSPNSFLSLAQLESSVNVLSPSPLSQSSGLLLLAPQHQQHLSMPHHPHIGTHHPSRLLPCPDRTRFSEAFMPRIAESLNLLHVQPAPSAIQHSPPIHQHAPPTTHSHSHAQLSPLSHSQVPSEFILQDSLSVGGASATSLSTSPSTRHSHTLPLSMLQTSGQRTNRNNGSQTTPVRCSNQHQSENSSQHSATSVIRSRDPGPPLIDPRPLTSSEWQENERLKFRQDQFPNTCSSGKFS